MTPRSLAAAWLVASAAGTACSASSLDPTPATDAGPEDAGRDSSVPVSDAGDASRDAAPATQGVRIVQYNVKAGQGGWTTDHDVRTQQVALIAGAIRAAAAPTDFVALEQADTVAGVPGPIVSDLLASQGLPGFTTIVSACNQDTTQLAYSSAWRVVAALVDGTSPQRGFISGGCQHGDGRPYNAAYFERVDDRSARVLVAVVHFPHGTNTSAWLTTQFHDDLVGLLGGADPSTSHVVVAGDMNEVGGAGNPAALAPLLGGFGTLVMSDALLTCCANSAFKLAFDRVVTNGARARASLIPASYPLNTAPGTNEEHKAIAVDVRF